VGYIHCDLKPDNIMIGDYTKDSKLMNKLYLIDFGISQSYLKENGEHMAFESDVPFKGNVIFSSKNAFD
jgi:serine/threonine protein kinase